MYSVINHSIALYVAMTFVPTALYRDCSLLVDSIMIIKLQKQQKSSIPGKNKLARKEKRQQEVERIMLNAKGSLCKDEVKGTGTQKYKCLLSESIRKTAHFYANCMEIRFLLLKLMRFYVLKMPVNGSRHFEINIKLINYQT